MADSDLITRLGPEATRLLKRARAFRMGSSIAFVALPLVLFAVLMPLHLGSIPLVVVALGYIVLGVPTLIIMLVTASRDDTLAARAAGDHLSTAHYAGVSAIPKALLRMPVEGVDSWLAVNHVPNPALPSSFASVAAQPTGGPAPSEQVNQGSPLRFQANWAGVIVGGVIALLGVLLALAFVVVEIVSLASHWSAGPWSILYIVACICCFAVGLPIMYGSTRKIAGQRARWYLEHDPAKA